MINHSQLPTSNVFHPLAVILFVSLFLNGCATQQRVYYPERPTEQPPVTDQRQPSVPPPTAPPAQQYEPVTGQAAALYSKAEDALHSGQYANSEMLLERALRIEPQNPHYWYTMAKVKYNQKQYPETVQFCLKAGSLASGQPQLAQLNQTLLEKARRAMNN